MIKFCIPFIAMAITSSCYSQADFDVIRPIIKERSTLWSMACKTKDSEVIKDLYTADAQYLPNQDGSVSGREAITAYWAASFDFVEDVKLTMNTLAGSSEILYETGTGVVTIASTAGLQKQAFKYVNVWRLEEDGIYRVAIDIFNSSEQP